ncbi:MAG TPA: hypothetical protein PKD92_04530 [Novosphingobium sp.]|nr:hypothetical protein [Novosphingobium sp.]
MTFFRLCILSSLIAASPAIAQAQAQDAPPIAAGETIYGPQGNEVGKVVSRAGDIVVVDTGKHSASLPITSFTSGDKGLSIGFTRDQLNDAVENAQKEAAERLEAALAPGSAVVSADGIAVGTVKDIDAEGIVTVERETGPYRLARTHFIHNGTSLALAITAEKLEEAIGLTAQ